MINFKNKKTIFAIIAAVVLIGLCSFYLIATKPWELEPEEFLYAIDFSKAQNMPEEQLERLKSDYQRAVENYQKDPNSFSALMTFAFINYQLQDYAKAKEIYTKVGEISPDNYNSFWNLGSTCMQLKDYVCAESAYLKTIENGPDQTRHYLALGNLYFSYILEKKSQIPDLYKKGLGVLPGDYDLTIGLAQYYRDIGDKTNAIKYYQEAINKYPEYAEELQQEIDLLK